MVAQATALSCPGRACPSPASRSGCRTFCCTALPACVPAPSPVRVSNVRSRVRRPSPCRMVPNCGFPQAAACHVPGTVGGKTGSAAVPGSGQPGKTRADRNVRNSPVRTCRPGLNGSILGHQKHGHRGRSGDPAVTQELAVICGAGMQRTQFGRKRRENSRAQARLASIRSPALPADMLHSATRVY